LIEVSELTKRYGQRTALDGISFSVPRGQVLGFLGPNGAGKSTTMRILTGYLGASAGMASVGGDDVFSRPLAVRRRIGYLPENNPLYNEMRVADYLAFCCRLRGIARKRRKARIDYALESCGLTERRRDVVGRLSKGLRQRVGLAQAVVHDPEVLILDEPTAGLDPVQTRETRELIAQLGRDHTVVLSSHILPEVSATCERVLIIHQGRIVADDRPEDLARRLSAGRGVDVELLVRGDRAKLELRLKRYSRATVTRIDSLPGDEHRVLVHSDGEDPREQLAKAVVGGGLGLLELRSRLLSLEDVFIQLVTDEERPAWPA
jgi:ABC-2 type transport system ATP-binding protein